MVIYTKESKTIIIPEGLGVDNGNCSEAILEAFQSGYTAGLSECSAYTDCSSAITEAYQSGYTEGYNQGLEDCPECSGGTSCNLETRNISLNNSFDGDETITPTQGYDGFDSVRIVDNGYGQSKYDEGYQAGLEDCSGSTDCSSAITEAYQSGYTAGLADCPTCPDCEEEYNNGYQQGYDDGLHSASGCPLQSKIVTLTNTEESITPDTGYVGLTEVYINAENIYNKGYTDGLDDCDCSSAITEAYQSGYTAGQADCSGATLVAGDFGVSDFWPGDTTVYPAQGEDGYSSFRIYDNGYGLYKYNSGYTKGYTDGFADAGTCDCTESNAIAYNSGFTNGYDSGYTDGLVDGHSSGYTDGYNDGWGEGYNQGQEDCPSCDIETGATFGLTSAFTGEIVYPTSGSGFDSIEIYDDGYGDAKYQEGYDQGYSEGYDQGYSEGAGGCTDAITEAYESGLTSIGSIEISFDIQPYRGTSMTTNIPGREHSVVAEDSSGNTYSYDYTYGANQYGMRYMTGSNTDTWLKIIYVGGFPAPSIDLKYLQIDIENENVNDLWANSTVTITGVRINAPVNNKNQYNWSLGDGGITLHPVSWSFGQSGTYFTPLTIQLY